jgi:DNA polymerase I-like protein with 3'-5' exonuclease and polymerase domains
VVLSYSTFGTSADWVVSQIHAEGWRGYVVVDLAVKCGSDKPTNEQIEACSPYLAYGIRETGAKRVLVCGTAASKATCGNTMHPWNYGSWTHVPSPNKADGTPDPARIMIVSAPDPADAIRNRFHQRLFRAAIRRAMRQDIPESLPTDVFGRVVLTPDDLKAFKAWLPHQPYLSYDVEWCGLPFTKEFKIVCLAFSHPDSPIVWIFDEALKSKVVHELIKKVLLSVPIVAQNVAAEFVATHCHFGVELEHIAGDTMLAAKLMNVDSKAALEDLAYYIGYNSHKREMNNEYARVREYVDANYPVHLGDASYKSFAMAHVDPDIRARYNALDTFITGELHEEFMRRLSQSQNLYLKKTYQGYILPATKLFHRVHVNGLLVDQRALAVARVKLEQQVHDLEDMLNSEHGIPDPRKVANIRAYIDEHGLFDTLLEHLSYDANGKKVDQRTFDMKKSKYISRKTQEMSTGKLTLKAVKEWDGGDDGGIASVLKYRELSKLLSSYGATLGSYIRDDGRVHPRYRLDGAASGRTSATSPNPQQIPKHGENSTLIKSLFCAPFGWTLVAFDYKTLEVFVAAIISGDEVMMAACTSADFHLETAKKMAPYAWGCTAEDVEREYAAGDKKKRTAAKGITFSILYGAGAYALADTLRCTVEQAEDLIRAYFTAYPRFAAWVRMIHNFAIEHGYVHVPWMLEPARMRPLLHVGFTSREEKHRHRQALRQAQNTPVQGCAAQFAVIAAMNIEEGFRQQKMLAKVTALVHDSIIVECHQTMVHDVIVMMYHAMTGIDTGTPLRLQVDAEIGETWGTMEKIDLYPYVGAKA